MDITQTDNRISIVSPSVAGYTYIHVIQDITIAKATIVSETFTDSVSYYTFESDGYFVITEFKLPETAGSGYYIISEKIYDPTDQQISVATLMEVDTEYTNILRIDEDHMTKYYLSDYYLRLLKEKYLKNICNCGCSCIDKIGKVELDTLTMGLDLIEALEIKHQYYEVQRIVEKLSICFGLIMPNCNC